MFTESRPNILDVKQEPKESNPFHPLDARITSMIDQISQTTHRDKKTQQPLSKEIQIDHEDIVKQSEHTTASEFIQQFGLEYLNIPSPETTIAKRTVFHGCVIVELDSKSSFDQTFGFAQNETIAGVYHFRPRHKDVRLFNRVIITFTQPAESMEKTVLHEYVHFLNQTYLPSPESNRDAFEYTDPETAQFFHDVMDELAAYANEGKIETKTAHLIPMHMSIDGLKSTKNPDLQKAVEAWRDVRKQLMTLKEIAFEPIDSLVSVFLTATSFEHLRKQLANLITSSVE